tara:strand:+ start:261 stop:809 length:549 start_codon:yes stop_codon:yes gene_type:complete
MPFTKLLPSSIDLAQNFTFTGTVAGAGADNKPSFSAFMNAHQSVSHNSATKLQFNTEISDSDSAYDHTSNYRFTVPSGKGGLYMIGYAIKPNSNAETSECLVKIYVNGSDSTANKSQVLQYNDANKQNYSLNMSAGSLIQLAASDYVEIYASIYTQGGPSGTLQFRGDSYLKSWFYGYRVHA